MAYDNIEIEIKIETSVTEFNLAKENVSKIAIYKGISHQIDDYFAPDAKGYLDNEQFPYKWLSIRQRSGKTILNYKHYFPEGAEKHQYCNEYETGVDSVETLEKIFGELKITKLTQVDKKRDIFIFNDELEIVFDEVKNLGYFIEIEALKDLGGIEKTREKVNGFIEVLGVKNFRMDYRGYPFLMKEKRSI